MSDTDEIDSAWGYGATLADNPHDVGSPEHDDWTHNWIDAQSMRRQAAGTFDHPPEFYERFSRPELDGDALATYVRWKGKLVPVADPDDVDEAIVSHDSEYLFWPGLSGFPAAADPWLPADRGAIQSGYRRRSRRR